MPKNALCIIKKKIAKSLSAGGGSIFYFRIGSIYRCLKI